MTAPTDKRKSGAAERIGHLERLLDRTWKIVDYWKVRALRAEGHDVPERAHPGHREVTP